MTLVEDSSYTSSLPCVATIGCFDGVHRGHRFLIGQVCEEARKRGCQSALITFPKHPRQVMQSDFQPQWLTCLPQKLEQIRQLEADLCIVLPFTRELSLLSARAFMQFLREKYQVRALVIGYDHRFGHNRSEGFDDYCRYGKELGIEVIRAKGLQEDGLPISSSLIRSLLKEGKIEQANHFLGYDYYIDGSVVGGFKVGRTLGFPTANILPSCPDKLIPREGVYATYVYVNGLQYRGMLNIGHRPTLANGTDRSIEVHLLDFSGDLYHHPIRIELKHYLRPEQRFESTAALTAQLRQDKEDIVRLLRGSI